MTDTKPPKGTTMEGMIWNAGHVLDMALLEAHRGVSPDVVKNCKGVVLVNLVDVGLVFAGTRGSGLMLAKKDNGEWSAPSSVTISGVKLLSLVCGANAKEVLIFAMDDKTMKKIAADGNLNIGADVQADYDTMVGRENLGQTHQTLGTKGYTSTYAYTFKRPATFEGCALGMVGLKSRPKENERFYGKAASANEILFADAVAVPEGSGIDGIYEKLALLEAGKTQTLFDQEKERKKKAAEKADKLADSVKQEQGSEVEEVDAAKE